MQRAAGWCEAVEEIFRTRLGADAQNSDDRKVDADGALTVILGRI